jgi:hypothetical protein
MGNGLALVAGFILGLAAGALQLVWLRRTLGNISDPAAPGAALRVAGGAGLRVLMWIPVLWVAIRMGPAASLALLAGLLVSRLLLWRWARADRRSTDTTETQG